MWDAGWMRSVEWLAAAAANPRACKWEWEHGCGFVLLEAGRFWNVLSVPEELGLCALDVLWRDPLRIPGPALRHTKAHRVGFLLPPGPSAQWVGAGVRHIGRGSWIPSPPPYRETGHLEWITPPDGTGTLYVPDVLEWALRAAATLTAAQSVDQHAAPATGPPSGGPALA